MIRAFDNGKNANRAMLQVGVMVLNTVSLPKNFSEEAVGPIISSRRWVVQSLPCENKY